jgi:hypothetical protein
LPKYKRLDAWRTEERYLSNDRNYQEKAKQVARLQQRTRSLDSMLLSQVDVSGVRIVEQAHKHLGVQNEETSKITHQVQ